MNLDRQINKAIVATVVGVVVAALVGHFIKLWTGSDAAAAAFIFVWIVVFFAIVRRLEKHERKS